MKVSQTVCHYKKSISSLDIPLKMSHPRFGSTGLVDQSQSVTVAFVYTLSPNLIVGIVV